MDIFGKKALIARTEILQIELDKVSSIAEQSQWRLNNRNQPSSLMMNFGGYSVLFDGEKTPNELGSAYEHRLDYYKIRMRAWEGFIKSTVVQTAIKQYCLWIVGSGLKFQATPSEDFLKAVGININKKDFCENVEARFRLFANSKQSTFKKEMNLHALISEALKNAILSGDVLFVLRYDGYQPTVDIIDGAFVRNPIDLSKVTIGNVVENGVEKTPSGIVVAYHVMQEDNLFARIEANPSGKIGSRQAWLMMGLRHKLSDTRGMSLLTAVLERDAKLDRYLEASVGSAEENSKMPYQIVHSQYSDGEDILINNTAQALGTKKKPLINETDTLNGYATKIAQTTGKQVYNMPIGAKIETNTSHSDPNFLDFYVPNAEFIYSTIGIPPEVALGKYGGSYSGSRAAQKGWEYKMMVERSTTISEFGYKPIYEFWFLINLYKGNIQAQGYLEAIRSNDWLVRSAYTECKFIGAKVPHIDPVKEANAVRILLGEKYKTVPLITGEQACENMNTGDFDEVQKVAESEIEDSYFYEEADVTPPTSESKIDEILNILEEK